MFLSMLLYLTGFSFIKCWSKCHLTIICSNVQLSLLHVNYAQSKIQSSVLGLGIMQYTQHVKVWKPKTSKRSEMLGMLSQHKRKHKSFCLGFLTLSIFLLAEFLPHSRRRCSLMLWSSLPKCIILSMAAWLPPHSCLLDWADSTSAEPQPVWHSDRACF